MKKRPKNAVATKYGWADKNTGELLVSLKGLDVESVDYKPNNKKTITSPTKLEKIIPEYKEDPPVEPMQQDTDIIGITDLQEEVRIHVELPQKPAPKRKNKVPPKRIIDEDAVQE